MRIVLADTHGPVLGKPQGTPNLGLLYLASYLRLRRPAVELVYLPQCLPAERHFESIASRAADVYALSFTSYGVPVAYALMSEVKRRFPRVLVVAGGAHATALPEDVLERSGADVCVVGEGEVTFAEMVDHLGEWPQARREIAGIAYRDDSRRVVRTPGRKLIEEIDAIPFPARDLVDDRDFVGLSHRRATPNAEMIVTRGCPYRCNFCANPVFRVDGPLYRARSPECIAREAAELYERGYREIYLHSDELNVRHDWAVAVCRALAGLGRRDLFFQCNLRVSPMSDELAGWLRRANFWMVRFGIESASARVLVGTRKKMSLRQTIRACRLVSAQGIRVWGYFLLYQFWETHGRLEHETSDEVRGTLALATDLWRRGLLHYSSWMYAIPVPGAELYEIARRHGMIGADYVPSDAWDPSAHLPGVSRAEFTRLYSRARRLQARMALSAGFFEPSNWRGLLSRARTMIPGWTRL